MEFDADAIVIGTGPSGVSVTLPMLKAGMRVLLLDGGRERDRNLMPRGAYQELRRSDPEHWRTFLGSHFEALRSSGPPSPKFDAPGSRFAYEGFGSSQRIEGEGFTVVGSLAEGDSQRSGAPACQSTKPRISPPFHWSLPTSPAHIAASPNALASPDSVKMTSRRHSTAIS